MLKFFSITTEAESRFEKAPADSKLPRNLAGLRRMKARGRAGGRGTVSHWAERSTGCILGLIWGKKTFATRIGIILNKSNQRAKNKEMKGSKRHRRQTGGGGCGEGKEQNVFEARRHICTQEESIITLGGARATKMTHTRTKRFLFNGVHQ